MFRADTITLIGESPTAHGVFDAPTETERTVMCEVMSVGMNESYEALSHGLHPSIKFKLSLSDEYQDEHRLTFNGTEYRVIRTYETDDGGIELTAERIDASV